MDATPHSANFEELLDARYSCRGFLPEPVPRNTIEHILRISQRTPSWCNTQPWQVTITSGGSTERFREAMLAASDREPSPDFSWPAKYQGIYLERRRECGYALYESVGVARGDRPASARQALENFRLFGAPHVAILTTDASLGVYGAIDCGGWVGNFHVGCAQLRCSDDCPGGALVVAGHRARAAGSARRQAGGVRHLLRLRGCLAPREQVPHRSGPARERSPVAGLNRGRAA